VRASTWASEKLTFPMKLLEIAATVIVFAIAAVIMIVEAFEDFMKG
jgi:hypothetical protein